MSFDALRWAMGVVAPHSRAKWILAVLADLARRGSTTVFASAATISKTTQLDRKTVLRGLADLESVGLIVRTNQRHGVGGAPVFELAMTAPSDTETGTGSDDESGTETGTTLPPRSASEAVPVPPRSDTSSASEAVPVSTGSDTKSGTQARGTRNNPGNQKEKNARARAPTVDPASLFPDVDAQTLADWQTVRKGKRAIELTETAARILRREADKAGLTAQEAIELCCGRNWISLEAKWILDRNAPAGSAPRTASLTWKEIDTLKAKIEAGGWGGRGEPLTDRELRFADAEGIAVPSRMRGTVGEAFEVVDADHSALARIKADVMTPEQYEAASVARRAAMARLGRPRATAAAGHAHRPEEGAP